MASANQQGSHLAALLLVTILAGERVTALSVGMKSLGVLEVLFSFSAQGARPVDEDSEMIETNSGFQLVNSHDQARDLVFQNFSFESREPGDACEAGEACAQCDNACQTALYAKLGQKDKWKPCHKVEGWIACPGFHTRQFGVTGMQFMKCGKKASDHGKRKYKLPMFKNARGKPAGCFMELTSWKMINGGGQCVPCKWGAQLGGAPTDAVMSWLPLHGKTSAQYSVWGTAAEAKAVDPVKGWKRWAILSGRAAIAPVRRIQCFMNDHPILTSLIKIGSIIAIGALTGGAGAFVAAVAWAGVAIAANTWQSAKTLSNLNPELDGLRRAACIANTGRKWLFAIALDVATCLIPVAAEAGTNVPWPEVHAVFKDFVQSNTAIAVSVTEGVNAGIADAETTIEDKIETWIGHKVSNNEGWWAKVSCTGVEDAPPSRWDPVGLETFQIDVTAPDKYAISVRDPCNSQVVPGQPAHHSCTSMRSLIAAEEAHDMDLGGATAERIIPAPDGAATWTSSNPWPYSSNPANEAYIGDRRMASDIDWEDNLVSPTTPHRQRPAMSAFGRLTEAYGVYIRAMNQEGEFR